jgi:hypothetical protein
MKKPEWPGIATAVGVVLIVAIALDLSKWQPLLAALIALGGGTLAYRGAMAKLDADREKDRVELDRRKLGLYLRCKFAASRLVEEAARHRKLMRRRYYEGQELRYDIPVADLRFTNAFEEFEEAWKNLDLLPNTVSFNLDGIRSALKQNGALLDSMNTAAFMNIVFVHYGHPLHPCDSTNEYLEAAGKAVVEELTREIALLNPKH